MALARTDPEVFDIHQQEREQVMPSIHELIPSRYIKKEDLGANQAGLFTISGISRENVGTEDDPAEKVVIKFDESPKGFVANITNINVLVAIYGDDYSTWMGKKIVVYFDPAIQFQGKLTGGLRLRAPKGQTPGPDLPF